MSRRHSLRYEVYMHSWLWRLRRWLWFHQSDRRCERCGCPLVLHARDAAAMAMQGQAARVLSVHHRHYRTLGRERRCDVQLLCSICHLGQDWWRHKPRQPAGVAP